MTPEQMTLVQTSFAKVVPIADTAATLFYERLFALDPPLRQLFAEDMREQRVKLMAMLATAVESLPKWDTIAPSVKQLGRRHATYGVKPSDYETVGKALLGTLEAGLGDAFTPEVREAWTVCYTAIAADMLQATAEPEAVQA